MSENLKHDLLGTVVDEIEGEYSPEKYFYVYPYGYGKPPGERNLTVTETNPHYPTRSCYKVILMEVESGYKIISAKQIDTSDPTSTDSWVDSDDWIEI